MKKLILALTLLTPFFTQAQSIKYETIKDDPSVAPWLSVNVDLFDMEMPFSSLDAAIENMSFNLGVWGHVEVPKLPVGIDYSFRKSWFVVGALFKENMPGHTEMQLGAHFFLRDNTKTKPLKVSLKVTSNETSRGRSTTETYITVNGKLRSQLGLRGGLMYKASGLTISEDEPTPSNIELTKYTSTGLYAGLLNRRTTNLVVDTDRYGLASKTSKATNIYLDALISFSNRFEDIGNNNADVSTEIKDFLGSFPIGARIGYQVYQVEKRAVTGKMFGLSARGEAGYRPYYGPYIAGTVGLTIIKAH
jgi:hypothetical protein